jgi:integrase
MVGKERRRLTDAAIARLRPREREYTVWDSAVPGLGVRVRPAGGKSYVLLRQSSGASRRVSLGPVLSKDIGEVRRECLARLATGEPGDAGNRKQDVPLFRDFVEGPWKEAHFDRYKLSTRKSVGIVLSRSVLPAFGSKPLDRITPAQVRRWFDVYSRTAPGGANRTLDTFRQIMNYAIACGHIETNPTRGVARNRRTPLTRFLSREEVGRLHGMLDEHATRGGECRKQADIIRLLLLTGCRKGEIVQLHWSEVRGDALMLADSKTGPRKVPLNSQARCILDRQPRGDDGFVFPSPHDPSRPLCNGLRLWYRVRKEAGIDDVRLHDLRHTHASHAVMNGVPVPLVSRLLGHSNVRMTLRYAHLGDRDIEAAAERVGQSIEAIMKA